MSFLSSKDHPRHQSLSTRSNGNLSIRQLNDVEIKAKERVKDDESTDLSDSGSLGSRSWMRATDHVESIVGGSSSHSKADGKFADHSPFGVNLLELSIQQLEAVKEMVIQETQSNHKMMHEMKKEQEHRKR